MSSSPHHRVAVRGRVGGLGLDLRLELAAAWTVVFGPSGSGKTTLLQAMAGLAGPALAVEFGRRSADGFWEEFDGARGPVRPEQRAIGFAPQEAPLLPHLDVRANLLFPARVRGRQPVGCEEIVEIFRLRPLLARRPRELSGGERQRVNVARALLVPEARLFLLDEPLTGVDRTLRNELLPAVARFAAGRGVPVVSVTHSVDEPLLLAAEVVRIAEGKVLAQGPAEVILEPERRSLLRLLQPGAVS